MTQTQKKADQELEELIDLIMEARLKQQKSIKLSRGDWYEYTLRATPDTADEDGIAAFITMYAYRPFYCDFSGRKHFSDEFTCNIGIEYMGVADNKILREVLDEIVKQECKLIAINCSSFPPDIRYSKISVLKNAGGIARAVDSIKSAEWLSETVTKDIGEERHYPDSSVSHHPGQETTTTYELKVETYKVGVKAIVQQRDVRPAHWTVKSPPEEKVERTITKPTYEGVNGIPRQIVDALKKRATDFIEDEKLKDS